MAEIVEQFEFNSSLVVAYIISLLLVLLLGLLANVLLCATVCSSVSIRMTASNVYVCNMACIHIIASLSAVLTIDNVLHNWTTGQSTCKVIYFILHVTYQLVSCFLMILHLDEYIKLKYVKLYQTWSISNHWKWVMVITWIVILICNTPQLIYQELRGYKTEAKSLVCSYDHDSVAYKLHSSYGITMHILKVFVTFSLNIMIRQKLYRSSSNITTSGGNAILLEKRKHKLKVLSVLLLLHFILASPQMLLVFFHNHDVLRTFSDIWLLVHFLYFSRYPCCTIVYIVTDRKCFESAKELVKCVCI